MIITYVRFVVGTNREKPKYQTGVVTSLRLMRDRGKLPDYEMEHVTEIFSWLNTHLPCPPFSEKKWSPNAISWFKPGPRSDFQIQRAHCHFGATRPVRSDANHRATGNDIV